MKVRSKQITIDSGLSVTGSLEVSGSSNFIGPVTVQATEAGQISLVVSGAMEIVDAYIQSASLRIGSLGTLGNPNDSKVFDLGGLF